MFYALSYALNRQCDVLYEVAEMAWGVLSGEAKMAWDVLCGVAKLAWDVLSGWKSMWVVLSGVSKNGMGCFVPGCFVLHSITTFILFFQSTKYEFFNF